MHERFNEGEGVWARTRTPAAALQHMLCYQYNLTLYLAQLRHLLTVRHPPIMAHVATFTCTMHDDFRKNDAHTMAHLELSSFLPIDQE